MILYRKRRGDFTYYLFTIHSSLKNFAVMKSDFVGLKEKCILDIFEQFRYNNTNFKVN